MGMQHYESRIMSLLEIKTMNTLSNLYLFHKNLQVSN